MLNGILCASEFVGKLEQAGIVVLIGVSTVFVLLFILIGVVKLLRYFNTYMDKWDVMMTGVRSQRAEIKAVKKKVKDDYYAAIDKINIAYENDKNTAVKTESLKKAKEDYERNLDKAKEEIVLIKAKYEKSSESSVPTETTKSEVLTEVDDKKLIAVITAAVAMATEQECAERKVAFKVRSIKQIR